MIPIYPDNTPKLKNLNEYLIEDKDKGDYRLHRSAFTDDALFELEMKHIFEGNWIYLAHESQVQNNNDYYTTHIGRQPIFIARNRQGENRRVTVELCQVNRDELNSIGTDFAAIDRECYDPDKFRREG